MAITAFIVEDIIQLRLPYPVIEIGPNIVTTIPPPIRIKIHMANKNTKIPIIMIPTLVLQLQSQEFQKILLI